MSLIYKKSSYMIFRNIFENIILKFWKLILFLILVLVIISSYQIKNLTIDASSGDAATVAA